MADTAPGVLGTTSPSQVSAAQWQSFEMRMRQRRATRLVVRAQAALEQGLVADAAAALEEARGLDSSTPDLATLLARVSPPEALAGDVVMPEAPIAEPAAIEPSRHHIGLVAVGASLMLVAALAVWDVERPAQSPASPVTSVTPPVAAAVPDPPTVATTGRVDAPAVNAARANAVGADDSARNESASSTVPVMAPETRPIPVPVETRGTPEPVPEPIPDLPASPRADVAIAEAAPAPAAPSPAPPIATPSADVSVPTPVVSAPVAPPQPPAPQPTDETPLVRNVLARYEAAYSSLDVSAAKSVWPSLDTYALARAFGGLQMQRISLGDCRVSLSAAGAHADCRGSAEWTPKIGGGTRSGARAWSFDMRKTDGQWRIVDATVR